jgi:Ca2+-binding EF-hand superfamily protein
MDQASINQSQINHHDGLTDKQLNYDTYGMYNTSSVRIYMYICIMHAAISVDELKVVMRSLGLTPTDAELKEMIEEADDTNDGTYIICIDI